MKRKVFLVNKAVAFWPAGKSVLCGPRIPASKCGEVHGIGLSVTFLFISKQQMLSLSHYARPHCAIWYRRKAIEIDLARCIRQGIERKRESILLGDQ